jgi:murein DD-endopeptidase MepM/ murein hydrolase activator NlpD
MRKVVPIAAILLLAGCSQTPQQAGVSVYGTSKGAGSTGVHTVAEGDTVYKISQAYHLPMRDIITTNSLSAPYRLNTGYRLKLPAPREYKVHTGDTLRGIALQFDTTTHDIARLNKLYAPYNLRVGQVLRLPTPTQQVKRVQATPKVERVAAVPPAKVDREVLAPRDNKTSSSAPTAKVEKASATVKLPEPEPRASGNGKFMWPVDGKILSSYGPKADGLHNDGINIQAPKGAPVRAAENGVVVYSGNELKGYGNLVLVRHADQWMTAYAHLDKSLVKKGDKIKRGQSLGTVGSTGQVDTPQLHFEIRRGTDAKNPQTYL